MEGLSIPYGMGLEERGWDGSVRLQAQKGNIDWRYLD